MPAYTRATSPPSPEAGSGIKTGMPEVKMAHFPTQPVTGMFRALNYHEHWALYNFECHARTCPYCHDPLQVLRRGHILCQKGVDLAKDVTSIMGSTDAASKIFVKVGNNSNESLHEQLEVPAGFDHALKLFCAMEEYAEHQKHQRQRKHEHDHKGKPVVSYDKTYEVPPRTPFMRTYNSTKRDSGRTTTHTFYTPSSPTFAEPYRVAHRPSRRSVHTVAGPFEYWR